MTTKHTPGPWHVGGIEGRSAIVYDTQGNAVANAVTYHGKHVSPDTMSANARLIATAPELLAALQAFVEDCVAAYGKHPEDLEDEWFDLAVSWRNALAAIAKAEGIAP